VLARHERYVAHRDGHEPAPERTRSSRPGSRAKRYRWLGLRREGGSALHLETLRQARARLATQETTSHHHSDAFCESVHSELGKHEDEKKGATFRLRKPVGGLEGQWAERL
jgi:hypothetical protein